MFLINVSVQDCNENLNFLRSYSSIKNCMLRISAEIKAQYDMLAECIATIDDFSVYQRKPHLLVLGVSPSIQWADLNEVFTLVENYFYWLNLQASITSFICIRKCVYENAGNSSSTENHAYCIPETLLQREKDIGEIERKESGKLTQVIRSNSYMRSKMDSFWMKKVAELKEKQIFSRSEMLIASVLALDTYSKYAKLCILSKDSSTLWDISTMVASITEFREYLMDCKIKAAIRKKILHCDLPLDDSNRFNAEKMIDSKFCENIENAKIIWNLKMFWNFKSYLDIPSQIQLIITMFRYDAVEWYGELVELGLMIEQKVKQMIKEFPEVKEDNDSAKVNTDKRITNENHSFNNFEMQTESIQQRNNSESVKRTASCDICYGNQKTIKRLPCNHCFHSDCLEKSLMNSFSCPICRKDMKEWLGVSWEDFTKSRQRMIRSLQLQLMYMFYGLVCSYESFPDCCEWWKIALSFNSVLYDLKSTFRKECSNVFLSKKHENSSQYIENISYVKCSMALAYEVFEEFFFGMQEIYSSYERVKLELSYFHELFQRKPHKFIIRMDYLRKDFLRIKPSIL